MEAGKVTVAVDVDGATTAQHSLEQVSDHIAELGHAALAAAAEMTALSAANVVGAGTMAVQSVATNSASSAAKEATGAFGSMTAAEIASNAATLALTIAVAALTAALATGLTGAIIAVVGALVALAAGLIAATVAAGGTVVILGLLAAKGLTAALGVEDLSAALEKLQTITPAVAKGWKELEATMKGLGQVLVDVWKDVGPVVLTALNELARVAKDELGFALRVVADLFVDFLGFLKEAQPIVRPVIKLLGEVGHILIDMMKSWLPLAAPAVKVLRDVFIGLAKGLDSIVKAGKPLFKVLGPVLGNLLKSLGKDLGRIMKAFGGTIGPLIKIFATLFTPFADMMVKVAKPFTKFLKEVAAGLKKIPFDQFGKAMGNLIVGLIPLVGPITDAIITMAPSLVILAKAFANILIAISPLIPLLAELMVFVANIVSGALALLTPMLSAVAHAFGKLTGPIKAFNEWFGVRLKRVVNLAKESIQRMRDNFDRGWERIKAVFFGVIHWFTGIWDRFFNAGKRLIDSLWKGITGAWEKVKKFFTDIKDRILGWVTGAYNWLLQAGKDVIQGFWDGLSNVWERMTSWIGDKIASLPGFVKDFFGIGSPSKLMRGLGQNITQGLWMGIRDEMGGVDKAMSDLTGRATGSATFGMHRGGANGRGAGRMVGTLRIAGSKDLVALIDARVQHGMSDRRDFDARQQRARTSIGPRLDDRT